MGSILAWILGNLPAIYSLVKDIVALIQKAPPAQQATAINDLKMAYRVAAKTGDTSVLHTIHEGLVGNSPQPVKE